VTTNHFNRSHYTVVVISKVIEPQINGRKTLHTNSYNFHVTRNPRTISVVLVFYGLSTWQGGMCGSYAYRMLNEDVLMVFWDRVESWNQRRFT